MENKLPKWFMNRLHTIAKHNEYPEGSLTVAQCDKIGKCGSWTPVDLILREYYNNGGGSSQGFLGIPTRECLHCYEFIRDNQEMLRDMDYYNEKGISNWGFTLWSNYEVH